MPIIPSAIKHHGNSPERTSICLSTEGGGITVLNKNALAVSDSSATEMIQIMGNGGSLEADILTAGSSVVRLQIPHGYRFLDIYQLIIGSDAAPSLTSSASIRIFGRVETIGALNSNKPDIADPLLPSPASWWVPLMTTSDENLITLSTEVCVRGRDTGGYNYALTLPSFIRLAGILEVVTIIDTAAVMTGTPTVETAQIVGRFTT